MILAAALATQTGAGAPQVARMLAAITDPAAVLDSRSPGARRSGTVQTKLAAAPKPHQRVLSGVRQRPTAPEPTDLSPAGLANVPLAAPGGVLASLAPGAEMPLTAGMPIGGGPAIVPIALIAPPPGIGGPDVPPSPPAPVPAVPEPMTWVTLLTGLALIAARLRHQRRCNAPTVPSLSR